MSGFFSPLLLCLRLAILRWESVADLECVIGTGGCCLEWPCWLWLEAGTSSSDGNKRNVAAFMHRGNHVFSESQLEKALVFSICA